MIRGRREEQRPHFLREEKDVSDNDDRCAVCGWPLEPKGTGCQRGNCSMRPLPRRYWDYERAKREYAPSVLPEQEPPTPLEAENADLRRKLEEALDANKTLADIGHRLEDAEGKLAVVSEEVVLERVKAGMALEKLDIAVANLNNVKQRNAALTLDNARLRDRLGEIAEKADCAEATSIALAALAATPADYEPMNGTWCPECGPNVLVDEEGLCVSCGATAIGNGANRALAVLAAPADGLGERVREQIEKAKKLCADHDHDGAWEVLDALLAELGEGRKV